MYVLPSLLCLAHFVASAPATIVLSNGVVNASLINGHLVGLVDAVSGAGISIHNDAWMVGLNVSTDPPLVLNLSSASSSCKLTSSGVGFCPGPGGVPLKYPDCVAEITWTCATTSTPTHRLPLSYTVLVRYALHLEGGRGGRFVSKTLNVRASDPWSTVGGGTYTVEAVSPFGLGSLVLASTSKGVSARSQVQANPFASGLQIALFARWPESQSGAFVSIANPWATFRGQVTSASGAVGAESGRKVGVQAGYFPKMVHRPSPFIGEGHITDPALIGLTSLGAYELEGLNLGERAAFISAVEAFYLDGAARAKGTVKVNVAWDESDYQIDVGTAAGRDEYKRIIDRNAELGVTHIVYEPRNTRVADRHNYTDGWGYLPPAPPSRTQVTHPLRTHPPMPLLVGGSPRSGFQWASGSGRATGRLASTRLILQSSKWSRTRSQRAWVSSPMSTPASSLKRMPRHLLTAPWTSPSLASPPGSVRPMRSKPKRCLPAALRLPRVRFAERNPTPHVPWQPSHWRVSSGRLAPRGSRGIMTSSRLREVG